MEGIKWLDLEFHWTYDPRSRTLIVKFNKELDDEMFYKIISAIKGKILEMQRKEIVAEEIARFI